MNELKRSEQIRISVIQFRPEPGNVAANLDRIEKMVREAAAAGAQLAIVPETATTGYFISQRMHELAETEDGPSATRLASLAGECRIHLAVGFALSAGGRYYDAQLLFGPDGSRLATYRKVHLFSAEREWYASGKAPMVVETSIGRIGMSICYDLMFPEFIRKLVDLDADLVINSTNWISDSFQREVCGWDGSTVEALARIRALENGVFVAMANCIGPENGFESLGHSSIVAPSGKLLASAGREEKVAVAEIAYESEALDRWRAIATYRADRRPEIYA